MTIIKAFANRKLDNVELRTSLRIFKDKTLPFFRIISYPDILSSLILEIPLDTIYIFLFGPNGRHIINLFKSTTSALGAFTRKEIAKNKNLISIAVIASLIVLKRIVELN